MTPKKLSAETITTLKDRAQSAMERGSLHAVCAHRVFIGLIEQYESSEAENVALREAEMIRGFSRITTDKDPMEFQKSVVQDMINAQAERELRLIKECDSALARAAKLEEALKDCAELDESDDWNKIPCFGACDGYGVCVVCTTRSCVLLARAALAESGGG